jgi:hypothetical protein
MMIEACLGSGVPLDVAGESAVVLDFSLGVNERPRQRQT